MDVADSVSSLASVAPCWRVIGVYGDRSCGQLADLIHCHNCAIFAAGGQALLERVPHADYIAEQTAQVARPVDEQPSGSEAVIVFKVAEEWLAMPIAAVLEVAAPRAVHRIPYRSNQVFQGIVNLRGELQLCVSLRALLGIDPPTAAEIDADRSGAAGSKQRLLVCQESGNRWTLAVDEVAGVWRVPVQQLGNVPTTIARGAKRLTNAVFGWNGNQVGRLDSHRLFAALQESIG
jgi:chemotaxis-related protein WspD